MEPPLNSNIDLYRLNWKSILENGAYKGNQIEELANVMAYRNGSQLKYNSKLKTVSFGSIILNLNHIATAQNSSGFSSFSHFVISNLSENYFKTHQNQIDHLAKLIKEKLELDKVMGPNNQTTIPLIDAVKNEDLKKVKKLIQAGVDIDIQDDNGNTPLLNSILNGNENLNYPLIHKLIKAGVNVDISNAMGKTPLWLATYFGHDRLIQMLIDAGAKVTPLGRAICLKDYVFVQVLINSGVNVNQSIDAIGTTPLEVTINLTDHKLLLKLIEAKVDINQVNAQGFSPLNLAVMNGSYTFLQPLIKAGADVNEVNSFGTPLIMAIESEEPFLIQELIKLGADVNQANEKGTTPLMVAIALDSPISIIQDLIKAGANVNEINSVITPLIMAINRNKSILQELINAGADVNQADDKGVTPLLLTIARGGDPIIIQELIKLGANVNQADDKGLTPLIHAIMMKNGSLIQDLINLGADVNQAYGEGRTPIMIASDNASNLVQILLDAGADVMKTDKNGMTVLDKIKFVPRTLHSQILVDLIKNINPETKIRYRELKTRLSMGHAWHLSGVSTLIHTKLSSPSSTIQLEGGNQSLWYPQMQKNLLQNPNLLKNQKTLENALAYVAYQELNSSGEFISFSNVEILTRIQAGLSTFIQTGYIDHGVTLLFWGNQMVLCNRGGSSRKPLEIYHFDINFLTPKIIESIRKQSTKQEYQTFFFDILPKALKFTQTNLDKILENAVPLPDQTVGNCSWVSPITGVFAYLLLSGVRGENEGIILNEIPKNLAQSIQNQVNAYRSWLGIEQITSLEKMIRQMEKNDYQPDHILMQNALRKAHFIAFEPRLSKRLDMLTEDYIAILSKHEALEFKTNLQHWKMTARMELPL